MLIRIGTRESPLALYQARRTAALLEELGFETSLVPIHSEGDLDLSKPLYEMGIQGVFTRALDVALLENRIDIAVHSSKDVPTLPAIGTCIAAILQRDNPLDLMVCRDESCLQKLEGNGPLHIASSSIRRRAQWLKKYPGSSIDNIRGNVGTRLRKLAESTWDGALFAAAGLERLGIDKEISHPLVTLDWMLPAPAQGAIMVMCREGDSQLLEACDRINHEDSRLCIELEREVLRLLKAGCSTPVGALSRVNGSDIRLQVNITAPDGSGQVEYLGKAARENWQQLAAEAVEQLLAKGGSKWLTHGG